MQTQPLASVLHWNPSTAWAELVSSAAAPLLGHAPFTALPVSSARAGDVVLVRVREVNSAYPVLETAQGREIPLRPQMVLAGVLGSRRALKGFSGKPPQKLEAGMRLHLLNKGGVVGECVAFHRDLGWPTVVEYAGTVCREGRPLNLKDCALPWLDGPLPDIPLILVLGTCMSAGKTSVCRQAIELLTQKGFSVHAGKVAGVACLQDVLGMQKSGARKVMSFHDFGLVSTVEVQNLAPLARSLIHHLAKPQPDFMVLEMGDGILGGYHVASLFADAELMNHHSCLILCANDLMGVWGGIEWLGRQGQRPALISGPVTDSSEGIHYIEENWHIPAANAFDCAGKLCALILESFLPWLELA